MNSYWNITKQTLLIYRKRWHYLALKLSVYVRNCYDTRREKSVQSGTPSCAHCLYVNNFGEKVLAIKIITREFHYELPQACAPLSISCVLSSIRRTEPATLFLFLLDVVHVLVREKRRGAVKTAVIRNDHNCTVWLLNKVFLEKRDVQIKIWKGHREGKTKESVFNLSYAEIILKGASNALYCR